MALSQDRLDELRARLDGIGEELADLAMDRLREGLAGGEAEALEARADEKRLAKARRAVDKAAQLLAPARGE